MKTSRGNKLIRELVEIPSRMISMKRERGKIAFDYHEKKGDLLWDKKK